LGTPNQGNGTLENVGSRVGTMHLRFNLGKLHFYFSVSIQDTVEGINSQIEGTDNHILLWDFDGRTLTQVISALRKVQKQYSLPQIYVISTGINDFYHAYCFKEVSWSKAVKILVDTEGIDLVFFKIGLIRGYWTLRISDKKGRKFELAYILESPFKENRELANKLTSTFYRTKRK